MSYTFEVWDKIQGKYTQIVITYDGEKSQTYINGVEQISKFRKWIKNYFRI